MHSFKTLFMTALLSTVIATPLKDRAMDNFDGPASLETRGEPTGGNRGSHDNDCGSGEKSRLDTEIHNREQLKDRLDSEIHRREEIKARLDEEIRQMQQNGGCGCHKQQNGGCGW